MIGERLKEVRNDHKDTQQMLADKLQVSKSTVQSWEQEKSSPSHEMLVNICRLYSVSADFLLGLKADDPLFATRLEQQLTPNNINLLKRFRDFLLLEQQHPVHK